MGLDNPLHLAILLLIVLLIFGARRLPEVGRSLGEGMRGFKDAITGREPARDQSELARAPEAKAPEPTASEPVAAEPQHAEPQRQEPSRAPGPS